MPLDFPGIYVQVQQMGEQAAAYRQRLDSLRQQALGALELHANNLEWLQQRVQTALQHNPKLRTALPTDEPLNAAYSLPSLPPVGTLIAADGSQINPDRHAQVEYSVVNVGTFTMRRGVAERPQEHIISRLLYHEQMYTSTGGILTEELVALMRDLAEREALVELARHAVPPVVALTDGQLELFREPAETPDFTERFQEYLRVLEELRTLQVAAGGYVDKPQGDLVVRLLELAALSEDDLASAGKPKFRRYQGVTDAGLFREILTQPGQRSAVFAIHSQTSQRFGGALALHFFYLNVGRETAPWIARVELPQWVAQHPGLLPLLHTALVEQSAILGAGSYPYALLRAHEVAVVKMEEKEQLEKIIISELQRRGVEVGTASHKQQGKNTLTGRKRYK